MTPGRGPIHRRTLLTGALAVPIAACAPAAVPRADRAPTAPPGRKPVVDTAAARAAFAALERKHDARLGVYALATGTGAEFAYRADERFAFCSTFKSLATAAVLHRFPLSHLDTRIRFTAAEVDSISPVTERHIGTGMTVRELCDAAIRYSDGTAGNLLMRDAGGPRGLTAYLRGLGDPVSRMDQYEPGLNRNGPADPRDTTTPRALAGTHRRLLLTDALPAAKRDLLADWMRRSTTGSRSIRAGVPHGWDVANKTGHGDYGRVCDVAVARPPDAAPLVIAILSDQDGYSAPGSYPLLADAARYVTRELPYR